MAVKVRNELRGEGMAAVNGKASLPRRKLLDLDPALLKSPPHSTKDLLLKVTGVDLSRCPCCHEGAMIAVGDLPALSISPRCGFFMNNAQSHLISFDSRSAGLARVCLALAKTLSEAAWPCRNQGKAIGADLKGRPLTIVSLNHTPCSPALHSLLQTP